MDGPSIEGATFPSADFSIQEGFCRLDNGPLMSVLKGQSPAYIVRNFIADSACDSLANAYRKLQGRRRADGVPAHELGVGLYGLTAEDYFARVAVTSLEIDAVFSSAGVDLPDIVSKALQVAVDDSISVRLVRKATGQLASSFRAIHWSDEGALALKPHEDRAQIGKSEQDFEAASVRAVVGTNVYVSTAVDAGGALRIWNIKPDDKSRRLLGVETTGYPYDARLLEFFNFIDVCPLKGDLLIFCADCIHAVTNWTGDADRRIVFSGFTGLTGNTALRWT